MSLTRKLLKEMELDAAAINRIIAAHAETVDSLKQERDAAITRAAGFESALTDQDALRTQAETNEREAAAARAELAAYRSQVETGQHAAARRTALADALASQGANPQVIPLLLDAIALPDDAWSGDALLDAAESLQPWRARYGALFAAKTPLPITRVCPPVGIGGSLTPADVKRMSAKDINRNWSAVRAALQHN